ncbi:FIST N-terminal domain-containing protein [uncultured Winogradskyella sp.]|uniref:FIST signal transduction protein n=1 Tax=uncultured Winogradskyella sp. TaxID=395353 RepID=UPI002625FEE9|nr:FIST N-terminal domain-containing protein [uncultured Winogradskyella sp.]|tara:strand:- start:5716 stop:6843 length:1128 start_codon:yes stop_codon:yes gene_type:complete
MKVEQLSLTGETWSGDMDSIEIKPNLILLFVSLLFKPKRELISELYKRFPDATLIGCSTSGEISGSKVSDNTVSLSAIELEKVTCKLATVDIIDIDKSYGAGSILAKQLEGEDLKHAIVFSDGSNINGADLVSGLKSVFHNTSITGGLSGYNIDSKEAFIIANTAIESKKIVGLGFYGKELNVSYGSNGGWNSFGADRLVSKSKKNIVFELDGLPALEVYKKFLGDKAYDLPTSALSFPFSMRVNEFDIPVVRTVRAINEENQSLIFAANVPKGSYLRLMKSNVDRLIKGAEDSAKKAVEAINQKPDLTILVSCIGRRLLLKQLVEEEVEAVEEVLGINSKITGFYSFGEIAPFGESSPCELHNQTMTVTTLSEC